MPEDYQCEGDGMCLLQCECECYDEETYEYHENCTCGHREHNGYCLDNNPCCKPVKCDNCNNMLPLCITHCHNGMCVNCAVKLGPHKSTKNIEECPVCLDDGEMLTLNCKHEICRVCWNNITDLDVEYGSKCPLCRHLNDWSKA